MSENPPVPGDKLKDILAASGQNYTTDAKWKWNSIKYDNVTRGDLMRLAGWMPLDSRGNPDLTVSPTLRSLNVDDMKNLTAILSDFNDMKYNGVYFCCTCA